LAVGWVLTTVTPGTASRVTSAPFIGAWSRASKGIPGAGGQGPNPWNAVADNASRENVARPPAGPGSVRWQRAAIGAEVVRSLPLTPSSSLDLHAGLKAGFAALWGSDYDFNGTSLSFEAYVALMKQEARSESRRSLQTRARYQQGRLWA